MSMKRCRDCGNFRNTSHSVCAFCGAEKPLTEMLMFKVAVIIFGAFFLFVLAIIKMCI